METVVTGDFPVKFPIVVIALKNISSLYLNVHAGLCCIYSGCEIHCFIILRPLITGSQNLGDRKEV